MRVLLTMIFLSVFCTCARAQVGGSVDAEYASWCMVDSIGVGQVVRFTRLVNIGTLDVKDISPVSGTAYVVSGTLLTCEAYDLREVLRDPLEDFYEDCQCIYTISQENNRTLSITGGTTQEYTAEFQKVVRRQCSGQAVPVVILRDTLTKTSRIPASSRLQYGFDFQATGQYLDQVDLRGFASGEQVTISIDLNPSTVQASYPALTLDPADFSYNGANETDMAAAWLVVITEAIENQIGTPVNLFQTSGGNSQVNIFTHLHHLPIDPYVILPRPVDSDYSFQSTIPSNPIILGNGSGGLITDVTYQSECGRINEEVSGFYLTWDENTPLSLLPRLEVITSPRVSTSTPQSFCDVSSAVCAELAPDPVTLSDCVDICTEVLNIAGHVGLADVDTTFTADTYNSISIYITKGPVAVTISGHTIVYPTGWSTLWSAAPGKLLSNSFGFSAVGGEAIISFVR
jgi:hypothetical protein